MRVRRLARVGPEAPAQRGKAKRYSLRGIRYRRMTRDIAVTLR
jgi:hypothetical protein